MEWSDDRRRSGGDRGGVSGDGGEDEWQSSRTQGLASA